MKKNLLLMMMCAPIILAAQNGVTVSGLAVDAGTVTFNVSWNRDAMSVALWSDTVWVFVDYNNNGVMERLPLSTGATLTETSAPGVGKVIEETGNNQGMWVVGDARTNGSFSATVKLLTATADLAGVCAYASNYPPVGVYLSASEISFTGTPEYKVVLERSNKSTYTVTVDKGKSLPIPSGETALSFTDKTGAPGKLGCIPMTGNIDFTVPAIISKGFATSFEAVTSNFTAPNVAALTYTWSAPEFSPDTHTGAAYTPTAPANPGTYPVALTISSEGYCDLEASKNVDVIDCIPSTDYSLEVSSLGYCEGSAGVTFALSGTDDGNSYQLYRDGMAVGAPLEGTSSPATFNGFFEAGTYTARTVPGGAFCPAEMSGTHTVSVNPLPSDLMLTANPKTICYGQSATLTASATSGASYSIDNNTWQTTREFNVTPTAIQSYTLYVKTAESCSATKANAATLTLRPAGALGQASDATCGCASGLLNCGSTCLLSCEYAPACPTISEITHAPYEGSGRMTWSVASTYCAAKGGGWRMPNNVELECIFNHPDGLPYGYVVGPYYSSWDGFYDHLYWVISDQWWGTWCDGCETAYVLCVK